MSQQSTELEFDRVWSRYLLGKFGCRTAPDGSVAAPIAKEDCSESRAEVRYGDFSRARELAKKVFEL